MTRENMKETMENAKVPVNETKFKLFESTSLVSLTGRFVLNEAKEEYITITSDLREKELRIDEQAKTIEHEEKIADLELQLENVNVCLTEKTTLLEEQLEEQQEAYKITSLTTLLTKLPLLDNNASKQSKSTETVCREFTFSQTFGPETTQLELFEQTVQQKMIDFLAGQNCTIMTYGKLRI
ncbi:PREDICTED: kinesin-like protein KIF20A [Vollenhovia emeryi]|uniref:kinesin-like protein KIF20A n=1 Tax=Vollenhovia emeryi TaxID=411798 RepID=UPI0005F474B2|nr:PREDICTED: kinesin-like protein KIF20A [Vollenhovia emeryi]